MVHYNSKSSTLRVCGIEHIPLSLRKGKRLTQLNQRGTFWIYKLQATKYTGLKEDLDFSALI